MKFLTSRLILALLFAGGCGEEGWTLRRRVIRQRAIARGGEARVLEPLHDLRLVEAFPYVTELNGVIGPVVNHEVDEQQLATGFQYTLNFAQQHSRVGNEV